MKDFISVGGIALPAPALGSGKVSISTLVDGGRNTQGLFVGSVIGNDKLKLDLSWKVLDPVQFQNLLKIWDRQQGGRFVNTFHVYDPRIGAWRDIEMYVGDRSGTPYVVDENGVPKFYTEISANLVEV